jgi:hypothetical protein
MALNAYIWLVVRRHEEDAVDSDCSGGLRGIRDVGEFGTTAIASSDMKSLTYCRPTGKIYLGHLRTEVRLLKRIHETGCRIDTGAANSYDI